MRSANTQTRKKREGVRKSGLRTCFPDRSRETRPTAPVRRDSAEVIREREDVLETMAVDEVDRRQEGTSVCPGTHTPRGKTNWTQKKYPMNKGERTQARKWGQLAANLGNVV